jgi:hypothetical protein
MAMLGDTSATSPSSAFPAGTTAADMAFSSPLLLPARLLGDMVPAADALLSAGMGIGGTVFSVAVWGGLAYMLLKGTNR